MSLFTKHKIYDTTILLGQHEATAGSVDYQLRHAADELRSSYDRIRKSIYANQFGLSAEEAYHGFDLHNTVGMTSADLQQAARIIKTLCNRFEPGTIVDAVPEVSIDLAVNTSSSSSGNGTSSSSSFS